MGGNGNVIMAAVTFFPTAAMGMFFVHGVHGATIQTLHGLAAFLGGLMVSQTDWSIKGEVALVAGQTGSAESVVIGTGVVGSMTGSTGPTFAGMMACIVVVEPFIAQIAPVRPVNETSEGFAPFEMTAAFQ